MGLKTTPMTNRTKEYNEIFRPTLYTEQEFLGGQKNRSLILMICSVR